MGISYSPLRYPGGKNQMYNMVLDILEKNNLRGCHYVEPFAGGAGIAIRLLFEGVVDEITINDFDISIYSFWHSIVHQTDEFVALIEKTPITIDEWHRQKYIYANVNEFSLLELGFATFFLNRTNRSGILKAGPIGGLDQSGNYKIDCRFNKLRLIALIQRIAENRAHINICNLDAKCLISDFHRDHSFFFIDPPYFNKGKKLYTNFFELDDHRELAAIIEANLKDIPWIITYDVCQEIREIYAKRIVDTVSLNYSLQSKKKANEFIFFNKLSV
ncbi:DNA adenine methylase [Agathobaculum sp. NTUH-O15-33]|uniref:DNA adenine methylase n=1 Tax=Agathobaculum sp. NTUH-O15-33 TaxID=3079302 RepID=UPI0029588FA3|nr:DNA adenine methylase [Agathobaculum sp. NTUH-O15-33]WNX85933.1 DNA adenine methylase [Agathobaculum sp. NTUH-O15-33]